MAGGDKNPLDDWIVPVFFGALLGGFARPVPATAASGLTTTKGPNISNRTRWVMSFAGRRGLPLRRAHGTRLHLGPGALGRCHARGGGRGLIMLAIFGSAYLLAWFVRRLWL